MTVSQHSPISLSFHFSSSPWTSDMIVLSAEPSTTRLAGRSASLSALLLAR